MKTAAVSRGSGIFCLGKNTLGNQCGLGFVQGSANKSYLCVFAFENDGEGSVSYQVFLGIFEVSHHIAAHRISSAKSLFKVCFFSVFSRLSSVFVFIENNLIFIFVLESEKYFFEFFSVFGDLWSVEFFRPESNFGCFSLGPLNESDAIFRVSEWSREKARALIGQPLGSHGFTSFHPHSQKARLIVIDASSAFNPRAHSTTDQPTANGARGHS